MRSASVLLWTTFFLVEPLLAQLRVDFAAGAIAGSDNALYAISGSNLFRTTDAGVTWLAAQPGAAPGQTQQTLAVATNPLDPSIVYAGTSMANGGVWKSIDSGATWAKANAGLPSSGNLEKFFSVENDPATFYVKIGPAIYKTSNAAASWTLQSSLPADGSAFTVNVRTPSLMYFARQALGTSPVATVYRSSNEGSTWDIVNTIAIKPAGDTGLGNSVGAIASSPADPDIVFLSTRGPLGSSPYTALHKGTARGASFAVSRAGGNAQQIVIDTGGNIFWTSSEYSAGASRVEKSGNAGATWQEKPLGVANGQPVLSLDLRRAGNMFAGLSSGVYRSTDAGETWTRLSGVVTATLGASPAAVDFRGGPGTRLSRNVSLQFLENNAWAAGFKASSEGAPWLTVSVAAGTLPAAIEVRVNTEGLAKGSYSGTVRISSVSATADLLIPVALTVTDTPVASRSFRISTVAGGGSVPPVGAPLAQAQFQSLYGVSLDPAGNPVLSSPTGNQVYRLNNQRGVVELIAGNGVRGSGGDGGPATAAQLSAPYWTASGPNGETYIADILNFRIRGVDAQGTISTLGTGSRFSLGGLLVDSAGNLLIASSGEIRKRTPTGTETKIANGPSSPAQMAMDAQGNMFLTDSLRHQVFRITPAGVMTAIAGTGTAGYTGDGGDATSAQLNSPYGVGVDEAGNIFIADTSNARVRMVDTNGVIFTVAGSASGPGGEGVLATDARLTFPFSLAFDSAGNLYMTDSTRLKKLTLIRPSIKANGVANAASYTPDASPGSLIAIFGDDLSSGTGAASSAPWATTLAGTTAMLNGRLMPLYYVSPGQVNAMVPYETPLGPATLVVSVNGVTSASYAVNISPASPGIITFGDNRAVAVNEDGSLNTASNPAKPGSTLVIYLIGIGPTDLAVATGAAAPLDNLARPSGPSTVTLGSQTVSPLFLGLTPGSVALAQLNLKLDDNIPNGDYRVKVTVSGKESNAPVISVRR